jgi:hypothetical protein
MRVLFLHNRPGGPSGHIPSRKVSDMDRRIVLAALLVAGLGLGTVSAFAAAADYEFKATTIETKKGDDVTVAVQLVHKATGKPVDGAVIVRTRIDMSPDKMGDMVSPVSPLQSKEPGTYAFKTDLPMAGNYLFSLAAKVQGEPETVVGKVILKAVK